jgi:hypothetical protein
MAMSCVTCEEGSSSTQVVARGLGATWCPLLLYIHKVTVEGEERCKKTHR